MLRVTTILFLLMHTGSLITCTMYACPKFFWSILLTHDSFVNLQEWWLLMKNHLTAVNRQVSTTWMWLGSMILFFFFPTFNDRIWIISIYLLEQTLNLTSAVNELHKLNSRDLYRLFKDAGNFSVDYLTGKRVLLKVVSFLTFWFYFIYFYHCFSNCICVHRLIWTSLQNLFHCISLQY